MSQLLAHYDFILNLVEEGANCDVVYLDFAKAFDKVDHKILCRKLKKAKIGGKVGLWINEFLSDRKQVVKIGDKLSDPKPVVSGDPAYFKS